MSYVVKLWRKLSGDDQWRAALSGISILLVVIFLLNAVAVEKNANSVNTFWVSGFWVGSQLLSLLGWATSAVSSDRYDDRSVSRFMWFLIFLHLICLMLWFLVSRLGA